MRCPADQVRRERQPGQVGHYPRRQGRQSPVQLRGEPITLTRIVGIVVEAPRRPPRAWLSLRPKIRGERAYPVVLSGAPRNGRPQARRSTSLDRPGVPRVAGAGGGRHPVPGPRARSSPFPPDRDQRLQLGFVYALIALGYTMVYGIVKLINFAHGDVSWWVRSSASTP